MHNSHDMERALKAKKKHTKVKEEGCVGDEGAFMNIKQSQSHS